MRWRRPQSASGPGAGGCRVQTAAALAFRGMQGGLTQEKKGAKLLLEKLALQALMDPLFWAAALDLAESMEWTPHTSH